MIARIAAADISDCSILNQSNQNTIQRNYVVGIYGAAGGTRYDQSIAAYTANPNQYVNNYANIYAYKSQIQQAILSGAIAYSNKFCISDQALQCLGQVSAAEMKNAIAVYLDPVISSFQSNSQLTAFDKNVLNSVIQTYNNRFVEIFENYADAGRNCFANPTWYGSSNLAGDTANSIAMFGFFRPGKILKKIINIAATILTEVVVQAVYMSIYGGLAGVLIGNPAAGWIVGSVIGGAYGIITGVNRCIQGKYVCIVSLCI